MFFPSTAFGWLLIGLIWLALLAWLWRRKQHQPPTILAAADLLAGGVLCLLTAGFFWRTLSGDVYQPADGGDLVSFLYPTYRFAASQLQQWTLPLWNPHLYGGAPFISDIQAGFLYPPNLLLFLLRPDFAYEAMQRLTIGHLYWAGLGLYVFLRTWHWRPGQSVSRPAALFGAIAFQFSDPLLIHLGNLNLIAVLSWLPWILTAYHQALTQQSRRWLALAAALFAVSTYAGHAQSSFYVALVIGLYTIGYWVLNIGADLVATEAHRSSRWPQYLLSNTQYPISFYLLALLLTAPILLPAMELTRFTERSSFTYQDTVAFSLAPTQVIGLLTPGFFGRGPALHWSLWSRVETPYAGVATLLLALGACFLADQTTRRRLLLWAGIALFGFVTALGIYAIIHGWLTALLPLFGQFRAPARALVLWTLGISILGAVGVDLMAAMVAKQLTEQTGWRIWQSLLQRGAFTLLGIVLPLVYVALLLTQGNETAFLRASVAALALTLVALFWLATWAVVALHWSGWVGAQGQAIALIALLFFDLSATGAYTDISSNDPAAGFQHPELVNFLRSDHELARIDTLTDINELWQPDAAALHGLQDVGGIANPLMLESWRTLWASLGGRQTAIYDMLNIHYVIVKDGAPLPEGKFALAFDAPGPLAVYRNETPLPRAWLVHEIQTVDSNAQAYTALQAPTFDPRQQAILVADPALPVLAPATADEQVQITHYGSNEIALAVNSGASSLLVLSEIWYPGWQATVNGVAQPIWQANGALRAIAVPSGQSTVLLTFAPWSWRFGLVGFGMGCLLILIIGVHWRSSRRSSYTDVTDEHG